MPVYTFKSTCAENKNLLLPDGITKIIINSKAAGKEANAELKAFLHYMNGKESNDGFIRKIEQRVREIKENETLRREYMLINSFERDARNDGWKAGMQAGMEAGIARGFSDGVRETAAALKTMGLSIEQIMQATNLSKTEIEKL